MFMHCVTGASSSKGAGAGTPASDSAPKTVGKDEPCAMRALEVVTLSADNVGSLIVGYHVIERSPPSWSFTFLDPQILGPKSLPRGGGPS